jgi:predicted aspartyl protease
MVSAKQVLCGLLLFAVAGAPAALALPPNYVVPMMEKSAKTFYVQGEITGLGAVNFLVDTGSSYNTIDEHSLAILQEQGQVSFVKDLTGILANGQRTRVAVYRIDAIRLGDNCELRDVEAAVFPGRTRHILGLSGLRKAGNFIFSFNPPQLTFSACITVAED